MQHGFIESPHCYSKGIAAWQVPSYLLPFEAASASSGKSKSSTKNRRAHSLPGRAVDRPAALIVHDVHELSSKPEQNRQGKQHHLVLIVFFGL